ncbi:ATP synthase F1 subunit gamma [Vescimonas sp.]|jgi:F-type H+-transporting ATPase subunit gamma|uniref:ATP synthase F1 subunit gamma n=1 Tax=Vescimonas sp. TaxID=2892404 RepID=UPI000E8B7959|nr:ATP synthase F1 subunit gamma [Oscillibacter sp.]HAX31069.1 ATP synthase F1 subunit gamma [Oscillibacter sp.]HCL21707.1 ATP synthase F1 subunit gamma [Oscillibacter sp.]
MASTSEIRRRIGSVRQTQKITHAMYLISQAKLRKAKQELDNTRPYFQALQTEIGRVFNADSTIESRYLIPADPNAKPLPGVPACLLITADKGLAGAYNQNVIRQGQQLMAEHPGTALYVVGEYGRRWFAQRGVPVEKSFLYTAQNPTLDRARHIAELLLDRFDAGEINSVWIIYTDMKNGLEATVHQAQVMPLHRERFHAATAATAGDAVYEFVPSAKAVLDNAARSCLTGYIYSALVDSFCSEQSARMTAMNAADQNAEELLKDLSVQFNRARQAAITQEITEVSAGERAQRSKKEKEG